MDTATNPKRTNPPKMTREEMVSMVKRYEEGYTSYEVAREFGRSYKSVTNAIIRLGGKPRNDSDCQKRWALKEDYFKEIDTPVKAYLLGFIYADGNVYKNRFKMSLWETDKYFLERFADEIGFDGPLYCEKSKKPSRQNMWSLTVHSRVFANHLRDKGVVDNKVNILEFPEWLSRDLRRYFIHGLMDGDGSITHSKMGRLTYPYVGFAGAKKLIKRLSSVIDEETGLVGSFFQRDDKNGGRLHMSGATFFKVANYLYGNTVPFFLRRKLLKYKEYLSLYPRERTKPVRIDIMEAIEKGNRIILQHEKTPYFTSY